jgi:hypothetical protein
MRNQEVDSMAATEMRGLDALPHSSFSVPHHLKRLRA